MQNQQKSTLIHFLLENIRYLDDQILLRIEDFSIYILGDKRIQEAMHQLVQGEVEKSVKNRFLGSAFDCARNDIYNLFYKVY